MLRKLARNPLASTVDQENLFDGLAPKVRCMELGVRSFPAISWGGPTMSSWTHPIPNLQSSPKVSQNKIKSHYLLKKINF